MKKGSVITCKCQDFRPNVYKMITIIYYEMADWQSEMYLYPANVLFVSLANDSQGLLQRLLSC